MSKHYTHWDRFYQKLNMIFNGVVASSMIPFAILFLQNQKGESSPLIEENTVLKVGLILGSLAMLALSNYFGPKWIAIARGQNSMGDKLGSYLTQKIKHYATIEVAALIALIGFFLMQEQIFSFVYVGILFVFSMHRPTFSRVSKELNVDEEELISWSKKSE
ncbi:MAG: hypothetical protein ABJG41_18120 [Cyclobacteriaceae bacterium]